MRGLQLIILLTTTVVLVSVGGWVIMHTWAEQELPADAAGAATLPVISVHLSAWAVHDSNYGNLDPRFERGTWYTWLRDTAATVGRAGALESLRARIQRQLEGFDVRPALVRGAITASPGVDRAAIDATRDMLKELGLRHVETPPRAGVDR